MRLDYLNIFSQPFLGQSTLVILSFHCGTYCYEIIAQVLAMGIRGCDMLKTGHLVSVGLDFLCSCNIVDRE